MTATADLVKAHQEGLDYLRGTRDALEKQLKDAVDKINLAESGLKAINPVTPNLMDDTYAWESLCGGQVNTAMEILDGHSGSLFSSSYYGTPNASASMEVVTLDNISKKGIPFGGDLALATNGLDNTGGGRDFYGSSFNILLFDVTINEDVSNNGRSYIQVINQRCPKQTGWNKGQVVTQSQLLVNVIDVDGDIYFQPHSNMPAPITLNKNNLNQGWRFHHVTQQGFGGCHQPHFRGIGKMRVAITLPYIGYGDHGGKFFWADSIRKAKDGQSRYSHHMGV